MFETLFESEIFKIVIVALSIYLIAAIPFGYWIGLAFGVDLTKCGSGSTGATNVLRNIGKWQAIVVLILDALKGFAPIYYLKHYTNYFHDLNMFVALFLLFLPLFAHSKSVYIGFKGGKSSATGLGILFAINWIVGLIILCIWATTVTVSGISSLGSIVVGPLVPFLIWFFGEEPVFVIFGGIAFVFVVLIKHRTNIARLLRGEEYNFKDKKD
jgi:acyl phosphate:glycerol-3-phosphate acyltransferase